MPKIKDIKLRTKIVGSAYEYYNKKDNAGFLIAMTPHFQLAGNVPVFIHLEKRNNTWQEILRYELYATPREQGKNKRGQMTYHYPFDVINEWLKENEQNNEDHTIFQFEIKKGTIAYDFFEKHLKSKTLLFLSSAEDKERTAGFAVLDYHYQIICLILEDLKNPEYQEILKNISQGFGEDIYNYEIRIEYLDAINKAGKKWGWYIEDNIIYCPKYSERFFRGKRNYKWKLWKKLGIITMKNISRQERQELREA